MWDPAACLKEFLALDLSAAEQENILYKNALGIIALRS
jgi:hypothetical protein